MGRCRQALGLIRLLPKGGDRSAACDLCTWGRGGGAGALRCRAQRAAPIALFDDPCLLVPAGTCLSTCLYHGRGPRKTTAQIWAAAVARYGAAVVSLFVRVRV